MVLFTVLAELQKVSRQPLTRNGWPIKVHKVRRIFENLNIRTRCQVGRIFESNIRLECQLGQIFRFGYSKTFSNSSKTTFIPLVSQSLSMYSTKYAEKTLSGIWHSLVMSCSSQQHSGRFLKVPVTPLLPGTKC